MILKKFFIKDDLKILDIYQALSKAGIGSAHNVVTDERIDQLQVNAQELMNKNATYKRALADMAHVVNTIQLNQSTAAPTAAATSAPANEMQIILNAITNLSRPVPVVAKPMTEMQQILALLTAQAGGSKNSGPGGGGRNSQRRINNNNNA